MGKLITQRAANRAAESAQDAAESVNEGKYDEARRLIAETRRHLDDAEKRIAALED